MINKIKSYFTSTKTAPKNGTKIVNDVINGFNDHIVKLNTGVQLIEAEQQDNKSTIEYLTKTNADLAVTKQKAIQFTDNLKKFLPV